MKCVRFGHKERIGGKNNGKNYEKKHLDVRAYIMKNGKRVYGTYSKIEKKKTK